MEDEEHASPDTQSELDRFRQAWLSEVERNSRRPEPEHPKAESHQRRQSIVTPAATKSRATNIATRQKYDFSEDIEPRAYHDLPNEAERLSLGRSDQDRDQAVTKEPSSALEHYERAVEKETRGQLGDSIQHYRKAFRLDAGVQDAYKKKHFPASSFVKSSPSNINPSNASATVPNSAHHSLQGSDKTISPSLKQLLEDFSTLQIEAAPPATSLSPQKPSFLAQVPEEILIGILAALGSIDVASLARVAQVCKRLAYVIFTEETIWKRIAMGNESGFVAMHYNYVCDVEGFPLLPGSGSGEVLGPDEEAFDEPQRLCTEDERDAKLSAVTYKLLHSTYSGSWRQMFRSRPRIRFNGCYISTVNYSRPGANSTNTLSWGAPVHVVTYYRYLRFFRDGTAISLLTTSEPADVVHHLVKENLHNFHGSALPSRVMKDALRGRWRLSGPASSIIDPATETAEVEGDVIIETEGVVPKYMYKLHLALANAGKGTRNNKLAWKNFWSWNKLTDDWAEFYLKNDRAFYWSRVKSYGITN